MTKVELRAKLGPRPKLDELLLHPIRKNDNGPVPEQFKSRAVRESVEDDGVAGSDESYRDWMIDHSEAARFYLGGFNEIKSITGEKNAKHYYSFVADAVDIAKKENWSDAMKGAWDRPASYNQFRKAILLSEPMFFDLAALVLVACECALQGAIEKGRYRGHRFDVYKKMRIIPACFNIDGFNSATLTKLRAEIVNFDQTVLAAARQKGGQLLTNLAAGMCVTRPTARSIRWTVLKLLDDHAGLDVDIGNVRGRPGKKRLGRRNATKVELVELDSLDGY